MRLASPSFLPKALELGDLGFAEAEGRPFALARPVPLPGALADGAAWAARLQSGILAVDMTLRPAGAVASSLRAPVDCSILALLREGAVAISLPDLGRRRFEAGDWAVLRSREVRLAASGPSSLLLFLVRSDTLGQMLEATAAESAGAMRCFACPRLQDPAIVSAPAGARLQGLASQIRLGGAQRFDQRLELEARCLDWFGELLRQPALASRPLCGEPCPEAEEAVVREVAAYLETRLAENHSLSELSRRFHINEFKLKRGFKAVHGTTVFEFLREARVAKARSLLEGTDLSILEIANAVGYANPSHFARNFKDRVGLLPKAYQCLRRRR